MKKGDVLVKASKIVSDIRLFFDSQSFVELSTPLLVSNPGLEPHLRYFETFFEGGEMGPKIRLKKYLPTSPEYHLKKAMGVYGFGKVYEIAKTFRNGETSPFHEPEFRMLEWYRAPGTYRDIAQDFVDLAATLGAKYSNDPNWQIVENLSTTEAFLKYAGVSLEKLVADKNRTGDIAGFEEKFMHTMVDKIEPHLGQNGICILWDYPIEFAALSRQKNDRPDFCERFEIYWKGVELANAFGELTDPVEQRQRSTTEILKRKNLYGESPALDEEFLQTLANLPKDVGGIAVGLDRWIMTLLNQRSLQDVIAFPHLNS
jgi:lysyl-tRNA synthetase class 2